jgi:acetyltransferase-like isoleucine patch superfamily enzyme
MKYIVVKLFLLTGIDLIVNKLKLVLRECEHKRLEQLTGCRINFVGQGFNGVKIISNQKKNYNFKIHPTSHLKSDTIIECTGGVTIGKYFHTGRGLTIFSTNHNYNSDSSIPYDSVNICRPVTIGDFVWCGANVTILPGVNIGEGVVVGAGTVVTKDVPSYSIIGGNPHRILKYRDIKKYEQIKKNGNFY